MIEKSTVQPGDTVTWGTSTYKVHVTAEMTGGRLGIFESFNEPDAGPPRHIQSEDEAIYVVAGRIKVWAAGRTEVKGPGELAFIPKGVEHTFRVIGPEPARFVVTSTPGGFEGFFTAVAAKGLTIPQDLEAINEVAAAYGLKHTGPPLGPDD
jgi:quercetin dioxygenase-like cupin family protein